MISGGIGGGNTRTGLVFEKEVDLAKAISKLPGYSIKRNNVFFNDELVGRLFKKNKLYDFIKELKIDWKKIISSKLLPDDSIYVLVNNTIFIIECKYQNSPGSVDEKLQTCDFKKKQYQKLFAPANFEVEYIYLLSNWFRKDKYKDVLNYILSVGCHYYFGYIPLQKFGLPIPPEIIED